MPKMNNLDETLLQQIHGILLDRCRIQAIGDDEQEIHLDSMALMELIVGLENTFNIKLDDNKLSDFYQARSVAKIARLVVGQLSQ